MTQVAQTTPNNMFLGGDAPPDLSFLGTETNRGDFTVVTPQTITVPDVDAPVPTVETPAVETPAVETPAPETPVVEPETAPETPQNRRKTVNERINHKNSIIEEQKRRIAELEARVSPAAPVAETPAPAPAVDTAKLRIQAMQLLAEGKFEEAAGVQEQIDTAIYERARESLLAEAKTQVKQETVQQTVEQAAAALIETYPVLDQHGPDFDRAAVRMINANMTVYLDEGYSQAEALQFSTEEVLKMRHPQLFAAEVAAPSAPAPAPRRADAATNVQRAAQQPPLVPGTSTRSQVTPIDISKMSDADFAKLTAEDLARARGDIL